jgi:hypothetical protein
MGQEELSSKPADGTRHIILDFSEKLAFLPLRTEEEKICPCLRCVENYFPARSPKDSVRVSAVGKTGDFRRSTHLRVWSVCWTVGFFLKACRLHVDDGWGISNVGRQHIQSHHHVLSLQCLCMLRDSDAKNTRQKQKTSQTCRVEE